MEFCKKQAGFTLIEIVIALAVFAVVGTMAFTGLNGILKQQSDLQQRSDQIKSLQLGLKYLERDISQLISRPVRDQYGDRQPAFSADEETAMSFTYSGWRNPAGLSRSHLQRVAYEQDEQDIIRHSWNRLDGAISEDSRSVPILKDVQDVEWKFLNQGSVWEDRWPPLNVSSDAAGIPRAVSISFTVEPWGKITRIFTVPK